MVVQFFGVTPGQQRAELVSDLEALGLEVPIESDPDPRPGTGSGGPPYLGANFIFEHADASLTGVVTSAVWAGLAVAFVKLRGLYAGVSLGIQNAHRDRQQVHVTYLLPIDESDDLRLLLESIPADYELTVDAAEHMNQGENWRTWHLSLRRSVLPKSDDGPSV